MFAYQERIKPALEKPNLDFSANVHHENLIHNKELITIELSWHNTGAADAQVDGFALNVYGLRYGNTLPKTLVSIPASADGKLHPHAMDGFNLSRSLEPAFTLIEARYRAWRPLGGQLIGGVPVQDTTTMPDEMVVPRGQYETIALTYLYCVRRLDDKRTFHFEAPRNADGSVDLTSLPRAERAAFGDASNCSRNFKIFAL